jgi:competence protein ComEA
MPEPATDPLAALDPSARRAGPGTRIAVGAAVVVFIAAVAIAAIVSFASSGGGAQGVVSAHGAAPDATGAGSGSAGVAGDTAAGRDASGAGTAAILLVHVLGAVAQPGLVELRPGARVVDAIAAAGGLAADADQAGVNLARPVADGEQLVVPRIGEAPPAAGGAAGGARAGDGLVHLNTADAAELDTLPRIGPALAGRIIDWREANGGFTSIDQLLEVAGIGDAVFAGIAELVAL